MKISESIWPYVLVFVLGLFMFTVANAAEHNATVTMNFTSKHWHSCDSKGMSVIKLDNGTYATICKVLKTGTRITFDAKDGATD